MYYGLIVLLDCKQAAGRSRLVVWGTYLLVEGYGRYFTLFRCFYFWAFGYGGSSNPRPFSKQTVISLTVPIPLYLHPLHLHPLSSFTSTPQPTGVGGYFTVILENLSYYHYIPYILANEFT